MTKKGFFITFEGSEGCGKSTQSKKLFDFLQAKHEPVSLMREPGGVLISEKVRGILLDKANTAMNKECETLLYMAARAQLVEEVLIPALGRGEVVLCDRFLDSTIAYQGYGCGVPVETIRSIGLFATKGIQPDLTIFFDLDVEEGLRRRGAQRDRIELRSLEYHNRVRQGYLALAKQEPERIMVIDGSLDREMIFNRMSARVSQLLWG